jgi:hypothetical protein
MVYTEKYPIPGARLMMGLRPVDPWSTCLKSVLTLSQQLQTDP